MPPSSARSRGRFAHDAVEHRVAGPVSNASVSRRRSPAGRCVTFAIPPRLRAGRDSGGIARNNHQSTIGTTAPRRRPVSRVRKSDTTSMPVRLASPKAKRQLQRERAPGVRGARQVTLVWPCRQPITTTSSAAASRPRAAPPRPRWRTSASVASSRISRSGATVVGAGAPAAPRAGPRAATRLLVRDDFVLPVEPGAAEAHERNVHAGRPTMPVSRSRSRALGPRR